MRALSQLTWAEIHSQGRHKGGCEKIPRDQLQFKLPAHVTDDTNIWAFRCFGLSTMLGYRDGNCFHILCVDPNFKAYDHG